MISTILLVPPEGSKLLEDPCAPVWVFGRRSSGGYYVDDEPSWHEPDPNEGEEVDRMPGALLLGEDGEVHPHGLFHAWWWADDVGGEIIMAMACDDLTLDTVGRVVARWSLDGERLGRLVFLSDGKEVQVG